MSFDFDALLDGCVHDGNGLGPRAAWPTALEVLLALMRRSRRPQYLVWGSELRFFYNEAFTPVMGIKHPAGFGRPMPEVWPEVWNEIEPLATATMRDGVSHYFEDRPFVLRRHGYDELTYFSFSYTPVQDDAGGIAGFMCVLAERTKEVRAREQRRAELDRLRSLFRQAPGFIFVTQGPLHEYVLVNDAFERLIGHSDAELLGRTVQQAFPELVDQGYAALLDRVLATGESFVGKAMPVRLAGAQGAAQETMYVDFVHQPILDEDGRPWGVFTQGSDVSDRVRAEAELLEANARKDQFLAVLGHELRNPLAPIHTAAELLRHIVPHDASAMNCVDVINRQARQMSAMVEDLLDIARISNGLLTLRIERVDFNAVARAAVDQLLGRATECGHVLQLALPDAPVYVMGDPTRLTQVVSNLLSNAIRYTPRGGRIQLSVRPHEGLVRLEVVDNGQGISAELLPRLFIQFAQHDRSPDRSGGLGIGLPLVKALVDAHSGRIEVDSGGPGTGSRFCVELCAA